MKGFLFFYLLSRFKRLTIMILKFGIAISIDFLKVNRLQQSKNKIKNENVKSKFLSSE